MKKILVMIYLFLPLCVFAADSILSFVDEDNEYWFKPRDKFVLDRNLFPINCNSYADSEFHSATDQITYASFVSIQVKNNGLRFILRWNKESSMWKTIPNLKNIDTFVPYTNYSVKDKKLSYTLTGIDGKKEMLTYIYDTKSKFIRYQTEFKGPDDNAGVLVFPDDLKSAKKKGLPGVLEIKCIGNPNDI